MSAAAKLRVKDLDILRKEEETLRNMIRQYRTQLNSLKVEELTISNLLGTSQDIERKSRNSTPSICSYSRPQSGHRALSTDSISQKSVDNVDINAKALVLSSEPLIRRLLRDQSDYEEEEEDV